MKMEKEIEVTVSATNRERLQGLKRGFQWGEAAELTLQVKITFSLMEDAVYAASDQAEVVAEQGVNPSLSRSLSRQQESHDCILTQMKGVLKVFLGREEPQSKIPQYKTKETQDRLLENGKHMQRLVQNYCNRNKIVLLMNTWWVSWTWLKATGKLLWVRMPRRSLFALQTIRIQNATVWT